MADSPNIQDQPSSGLNPRMAGLQALFPQPQQAQATPAPAQPAAAPGGGGQPPDIMQEMIEASRQGRGMVTGEAGKVGDIGSQIQGLVQQQQQTPLPKMGFLDTQGQPQKGGFLHNLGRALIAIGTSTTPGQAIQSAYYAPGIRRYEAETGARAQQIKELQGQQEEHEKLATAGAGMVSKPITAAGSAMRGEAAVSKADTYAQQVQNQLTLGLKGLDLKGIATGSQVALNAAKAKLLDIKAQLEPSRVAIAKEGVELGAATKQAIANAIAAAGIQKDHPIMSLVDSIFGTDYTPAAPQTDTGKAGTGATVPPKKPAATAKPTAGKMRVTLSDGRTGTIDASEFDAKTMKKVP